MDNPLEHALDRELLAFYQDEYAARGEEMYHWYKDYYIPQNIGLAPYNIAIADFVMAHCPELRFVEIGAGIGQISMLLATRRHHSSAVEAEASEIFPMAQRAFARITEKVFLELPNYMTLIHDRFPNRAATYVTPDSLICFPTLYEALSPEQEIRMLDVIAGASGVILSLRDFFRVRHSETERDILVAQFRARGFEAPIKLLDWESYSPDTTIYMKKPRPARRSFWSRLRG